MLSNIAPRREEPSERKGVRAITVYATKWFVPETSSAHTTPAAEFPTLKLGRLKKFYSISADQVPRVIHTWGILPHQMWSKRWDHHHENSWNERYLQARIWALAVPSGRIVIALSTDAPTNLIGSIELLEDHYYCAHLIDNTPLPTWVGDRLTALGIPHITSADEFSPERHQLVFQCKSASDGPPTPDQLQRVIYRADMPATPESCSFRTPAELNRRPHNAAAVGAYVSVIAGHQQSVEDSAFLSAVLTIASATGLREIRERVYDSVRTFRNTADNAGMQARRIVLENIADLLGEQELELSFGVEATADLGMLIQSLRVESYHAALCQSISLDTRSETTGRMLDRLRTAVADELTTINSAEDRRDSARSLRTAVAVTFVTTIGGTLAVLFSFFGVNASQVQAERSMFDPAYLPIYLLMGAIVGGSLLLYSIMAFLNWRSTNRRPRQ